MLKCIRSAYSLIINRMTRSEKMMKIITKKILNFVKSQYFVLTFQERFTKYLLVYLKASENIKVILKQLVTIVTKKT